MFLDVALMEMGMHPSQRPEGFTVKLTGGPDGDVAGNMIKIMHREYGSAVRVVGLADATGCAEDPDGLDIVHPKQHQQQKLRERSVSGKKKTKRAET